MTPLTLPATLDSLASIGEYVLRAADLAGLDKRRAYRLRLAVDEIATNIVAHGRSDQAIEVHAVLGETTLVVSLEDSGPPFDPLTVTPPGSLEAPLADRPIGGLGVFLATRSVDEFVYERVGERNRNLFAMQRGPVGRVGHVGEVRPVGG